MLLLLLLLVLFSYLHHSAAAIRIRKRPPTAYENSPNELTFEARADFWL